MNFGTVSYLLCVLFIVVLVITQSVLLCLCFFRQVPEGVSDTAVSRFSSA